MTYPGSGAVGHFPVYFTSATNGVFAVDKEKNDEVDKRARGLSNPISIHQCCPGLLSISVLPQLAQSWKLRSYESWSVGLGSRMAYHAPQVDQFLKEGGWLCFYPEGATGRPWWVVGGSLGLGFGQ